MNEHSKGDSDYQEIVSNFEKLDFVSLWEGRDKVNLLEKKILTHFLKSSDGRRILEIGPGNGRLTGTIKAYASEFVATDINMSFLNEVKLKYGLNDAFYVASNLYHLPFANNSFSSVVMIRVFNFISRPLSVIEELSRVLVNGGHVLISISPRPSLSTLIDDLKYIAFSDHSKGQKKRSITFSNKDMTPVHPASYPTFAFRSSFIRSLFKEAGFKEVGCVSSGLEDYSILRAIPAGSLFNIGIIFRSVPIFPTMFFHFQKGNGNQTSLRVINDILQCPSCSSKLPIEAESGKIECAKCRFVGFTSDGIIDLTYVPQQAKVAKDGQWQ